MVLTLKKEKGNTTCGTLTVELNDLHIQDTTANIPTSRTNNPVINQISSTSTGSTNSSHQNEDSSSVTNQELPIIEGTLVDLGGDSPETNRLQPEARSETQHTQTTPEPTLNSTYLHPNPQQTRNQNSVTPPPSISPSPSSSSQPGASDSEVLALGVALSNHLSLQSQPPTQSQTQPPSQSLTQTQPWSQSLTQTQPPSWVPQTQQTNPTQSVGASGNEMCTVYTI